MRLTHFILPAAALAMLCLGCPPERTPLPPGAPPEYEEPRAYEPERNIDNPDTAPDPIDAILEEDDPPAAPASASAPPLAPGPAASAAASASAAPAPATSATTSPATSPAPAP